jgi:hypothetical protein
MERKKGESSVDAFRLAADGRLLLLSAQGFQNGVTAGFTTRNGGFSQGVYATFNQGLHVGDDRDDVIRNRRLLLETLSFPLDEWVSGEQVHGSRVAVVGSEAKGAGLYDMDSAIKGVDGLVTDQSGLLLTAGFADCVPLYFVDPIRRVIGLAHAGWRGTVGNIVKAMIDTFARRFGTSPQELRAGIGPSIGACCYQVGQEVMDKIALLPLPAEDLAACCQVTQDGRYFADLKMINRLLMMNSGIPEAQIAVSEACTGCSLDRFFSHRMENGQTGRHAAWIGLV